MVGILKVERQPCTHDCYHSSSSSLIICTNFCETFFHITLIWYEKMPISYNEAETEAKKRRKVGKV